MQRVAFALLLLSGWIMSAYSAELKTLSTQQRTSFSTTALPLAPTVEEKIAKLAAMVEAQQTQISELNQKLIEQSIVIEQQSTDLEEVNTKITVLDQVFAIDGGLLTINVPSLAILTNSFAIESPQVNFAGNVQVNGLMHSQSVKTEFIDAELYTPGAGNIW